MILFFVGQAARNSMPLASFYLALFILGDVFSLNTQSYAFFCFFITLLAFDPLLQYRPWIESLFYCSDIEPGLKIYIAMKSLFVTLAALCVWLIFGPKMSLSHYVFVGMILYFNTLISHLIVFFFEDVLPFFLLPMLSLSVVTFNAFFLSSGLAATSPLNEIKILISLYLVLIPSIHYTFTHLLDFKYGPFEADSY